MSEAPDLIAHTISVVSAFVGQNRLTPDELPAFIASTHGAIARLQDDGKAEPIAALEQFTPAVSARKSLGSKDHIISMIDGKPYKTLRRHLSTHGLTPEQYRERYKLPLSYPMVAEAYSATRREMAKKIGLGRKPGARPEITARPKAPRKARSKVVADS